MYVAHAEGARFTGVDGREYVDMCCSHGAALLGHGHPAVRKAMARAIVQHSGTFNAPLTNILGGLVFCDEITQPAFYPQLHALGERFYAELDEVIRRVGVPVVAPRHGARFGLVMGLDERPMTYRDALNHRSDAMLAFVRETAQRGVYFHDYGGGACHHGFSAVHTEDDLARVLEGVEGALRSIKDMLSSHVH